MWMKSVNPSYCNRLADNCLMQMGGRSTKNAGRSPKVPGPSPDQQVIQEVQVDPRMQGTSSGQGRVVLDRETRRCSPLHTP